MNKNKELVWLTAASVLLLAGLGAWLLFGRGYAPISDKGYELALAMISACNRQDLARVESILELTRQAEEQRELPKYDARVLERIGRAAMDGDWEKASREARRLLDSQVKSAGVSGRNNQLLGANA